MKKQVPLTPVLAVALAIVLAAAYFALIRPKAAESAQLDEEIAALAAEAAVAGRRAPEEQPRVQIDVADLFRLAKAMPDGSDMAGIMLELNGMAASAGITFVSIQPAEPVSFTDSSALPINLTFHGNYYDLTDFLYRMRNLVTVKDGVLDASGRLYTLDALDLHEAPAQKFPLIEAVLTLSAYSYGAAAIPTVPGAPPTDTSSTTTTGATTTGETTTTEQTSTDPPDAEAAGP
ncbi:MAG TPA: type 4a pilus biogenesis protein PilO [Gaiellaceae bacterium]|nr:type 4a pilus biogenesis protein PilO [Gaiellaceae bacterium]